MAPDNHANPNEVARRVNAMNRAQLTWALLTFESQVPLDFSAAYLASLTLDQLRHILWTAILCLTPAT
ncbi:MAG: hypothetical protein GY842_00190 [bacterium]|nr:hypothetical protein [bacterium]